jgi:hypothetical protein
MTDKFIIASCDELTEDDLIKELNTYYQYELKNIVEVRVYNDKMLTPANLPLCGHSGDRLYLVRFQDDSSVAHLLTYANTSMGAKRNIEKYIEGNSNYSDFKVTQVNRLQDVEDIITL